MSVADSVPLGRLRGEKSPAVAPALRVGARSNITQYYGGHGESAAKCIACTARGGAPAPYRVCTASPLSGYLHDQLPIRRGVTGCCSSSGGAAGRPGGLASPSQTVQPRPTPASSTW